LVDERPLSDEDAAFYRSLPRKRVGAGALITDAAGRVLLVEPTYKSNWEVPGGLVEGGETAFAACRRECREELGLDLAVGRILVVDHHCDAGDRGDSVMFLYDGGVLGDGAAITLPAEELRSYRFVEPDDLGDVAIERLARRLRFALAARRDGTTIELVEGQPTGP
jgi:ADP-ribose pyrophosphatase YjhB (NUDIX family)